MHQFKHGCLPSVFNNLFTKFDNIHSYTTRQKTSQEYIVSRKRLATGQKSVAYMGVKIWESLDQNLKLQPFYVFKKKCKLHFKPILTRANQMLPLVFLNIIINLSHGTNLKHH